MDQEIVDRLTPEIIWQSTTRGWFPMADDGNEIGFYEPTMRTLMPIEGIHVSRSLMRTIRKGTFEIRFDTSFEQVIRSCLRPKDNWINEEIIGAYTEIHRQGWGHCCECWLDGKLVGGVYGIVLGSCFSAESMFHRATDASKVALWALVERCRASGFTMFDAQLMNPHLESLGAFQISQVEYMRRLAECLRHRPEF